MKRKNFIRDCVLGIAASFFILGCTQAKHTPEVVPTQKDSIVIKQDTFGCIDSMWGDFNIDTITTSDTVDGGYVIRKHWKSDIDTSDWRLYKIDTTFHYYRIISYECADEITEINGDTAKIFKTISPIYLIGTLYCAVAHYNYQYCIASCLFNNASVNDTIPYPMDVLSKTDSGWKYQMKYYVGWVFIRDGRDSIVKE